MDSWFNLLQLLHIIATCIVLVASCYSLFIKVGVACDYTWLPGTSYFDNAVSPPSLSVCVCGVSSWVWPNPIVK